MARGHRLGTPQPAFTRALPLVGAALALCLAASPALAQRITIERVVAAPSGLATPDPQPIASGADWYDQPLAAEGATRLRIVSPEPTVAAALLFDQDAAQPGGLLLRIIILTDPDPIELRQLQPSRAMLGGKLVPAKEHWAARGVNTELRGEAGIVTRIVVQDDYGSALRWSQAGDLLVLEAIPPEAGGRPAGDVEPWYARRPLTFIDYRLMGGGYGDSDSGNALGDLFVLDFLAARFNGFFTTSDTHYLARVVLRTQAWRGERIAAWAEGGGAFWQKLRSDNSADDEDLTWVIGGTGVYRVGDWGGQGHLAYLNGPLVVELLGGWQMARRLGLLAYWHSFDGSTGYGLGLGADF